MNDKIIVLAEQWKRRVALKAEISALERQVKAIESQWPIPDATETLGECQLLIVDGNGDTQGKVTYYHFAGSVTPPGWRKRIS